MAIIQPEIIAMARVYSNLQPGFPAPVTAEYKFSNGFDASKVTGAYPWAPSIYYSKPNPMVDDNYFTLFLESPVAPGKLVEQGGLKARVDLVEVATPTYDPAPYLATGIAARCCYGNYNLAATPYKDVDPQKAITVLISNPSPFSLLRDVTFDIVVFQNVETSFVPKAR